MGSLELELGEPTKPPCLVLEGSGHGVKAGVFGWSMSMMLTSMGVAVAHRVFARVIIA